MDYMVFRAPEATRARGAAHEGRPTPATMAVIEEQGGLEAICRREEEEEQRRRTIVRRAYGSRLER